MRRLLAGALGRLWSELVQGLILLGTFFAPGAVVFTPPGRPGRRTARDQGRGPAGGRGRGLAGDRGAEPAEDPGRLPGGAHPERLVPYAQLSEDERRFWDRLAQRVTSGGER